MLILQLFTVSVSLTVGVFAFPGFGFMKQQNNETTKAPFKLFGGGGQKPVKLENLLAAGFNGAVKFLQQLKNLTDPFGGIGFGPAGPYFKLPKINNIEVKDLRIQVGDTTKDFGHDFNITQIKNFLDQYNPLKAIADTFNLNKTAVSEILPSAKHIADTITNLTDTIVAKIPPDVQETLGQIAIVAGIGRKNKTVLLDTFGYDDIKELRDKIKNGGMKKKPGLL